MLTPLNANPYLPPSDIEIARSDFLGGLPRVLATKLAWVIVSYLLVAIAMLYWHLTSSELFDQPSIGLMTVFAMAATLVGLLLIWLGSGILNWGQRIVGIILVVAFLVGMLVWEPYLLWQMLQVHASQAACLAIALAICRWLGWTIRHSQVQASISLPAALISVRGLAALAASMATAVAALLFYSAFEPNFETSIVLASILVAGGGGAAAMTLTALRISFSDSPWLPRVILFIVIAPMGGVIYLIATIFTPFLLFNAPWFAGVTTLQMVLLLIPFAVARKHGFAIRRIKDATDATKTSGK